MEARLESRMQWMDFLRGICILLVLLLHSTTIFQRFDLIVYIPIVDLLNNIVAPFRMPLLVFLSGCLFSYSFKKGFEKFLHGKIKNILWPYAVWSIITLVVMNQLDLINLIRQFFSSSTTLWFLWFIFFYYIIFYFVINFKLNLAIFLLVVLFLSFIMPETARLSRFFYLFVFFILGHLFFIKKISDYLTVKFILISIFSLFIYALLYRYGIDIRYNPLYIYIPILFIFGLMSIKCIYISNFYSRWIEFIGRKSIYYYASHYVILYFLTKNLLSSDFELINIFLINIFLVLFFGTIFSKASEKIIYLRKFFSY